MEHLKTAVKLVVTVVIFYFLLTFIDVGQLIAILAKSHGGYILIAFAAQMASTFLAAYRWRLIMKELGFKEKVSFYVQSYFKGTFFNQVLPGSIGGDATRMIDLVQKGYEKKDAFYGIFVDRVVGLVGLLVLNLVSNVLFYGTFPQWLFNLINLITLGGIAGFILMLNLDKFTFLANLKGLDLFHRLGLRMARLYHSRLLLLKHIGISVVVHLFTVVAIYFLALSVDVWTGLGIFLVAVPPVFLLTIVPISLAGWGVREGAMVGILMLVGLAKAKILAISILYGILLILTALPGAWFWNRAKHTTSLKENA
ncbi:lysylphosphatidylglycerol synthase transmembrane domain-containing protein [Sulfurimonas sp. HSL1-2]|uniref:lysylphosphatidylglycerol synthase transmembrane domain-containing protein n=1 Tax=Thiomicrolovo zhangzhouensis TaxID=3131933 RepID=UPI0031F86D30